MARFYVRVWTPADNGARSQNPDQAQNDLTLGFGRLEGPRPTHQEAQILADSLARPHGDLSAQVYAEVMSKSAVIQAVGRGGFEYLTQPDA